MKNVTRFLLLAAFAVSAVSCAELFGTKKDKLTDEIFEQGRLDPNVIVDVVGYAALVPFWEGFNKPTAVTVGYDELIYVTDADGVHVLDRAGRRLNSYALRGAVAITQDRNLNVFVAARFDTVVSLVSPTTVWDLACVYVLRDLNRSNSVRVVDKLVHPFTDDSRGSTSARIARLSKTDSNSDERVEFTGIATLADNTVYVTRRGPVNSGTGIAAPDNTVLEFTRLRNPDQTFRQKWVNARQITALNPTVPSLISAVKPSAIMSFIAPPQRERMSPDRSFLIAQADTTQPVPYRVLWISAVESPEGLSFQPNTTLLAQDTSKAERFLYGNGRFRRPSGLAFAADGTNYIFMTDAATDSLHIFQTSGVEGIRRPGAPSSAKAVIASFGGRGTGPRQFNKPSGVAYFRRVVYVADRDNNRICRFKLNTDFE